MRRVEAVCIREPGDPEVLHVDQLEVRDPGFGEVRVEVAAAGLNRADLLQRRGHYPAPPGAPPDVPGLEYAGTVAEVGAGVPSDEVAVGDRVMGIVGGGGMAREVVVHARELLPVPKGLSLAQAAAVPEVFLTAYDALVVQAGLGLGEVALLHAVGSGVGTAAVQLCRAVGARPIGTSRTQDKLDRCAVEVGLDEAILVQEGSFAGRLEALTGGRQADVILDPIGAAYLGENLKAAATGARIVVLGLMGGSSGTLPLGTLMRRRVRLQGTVLRARPIEAKASLTQRFAREALPLFEDGRLRPIVDEVLPMTEVVEAHRRMEANETFGKLVLTWDAAG